MYQVLLTNLPTNAIVGKMFIRYYFFPCDPVLNNDDYISYIDEIPSVETVKQIHLSLLRGKNIVIYKFRFNFAPSKILQSYLRMYPA